MADEEAGRFRRAVRIEDAAGHVHGVGVLLDDTVVLTCAHVVSAATGQDGAKRPEAPAFVRPGRPHDSHPRAAHVPDASMWVPGDVDVESGGDIALLHLVDPITGIGPMRVRRGDPERAGTVRAVGFPEGDKLGMWARTRIAGETICGVEWWQLEPVGQGPRITPGFSGGAVLGREDRFLGIVVARFVQAAPDAVHTIAYMIPVETLIGYCPPFANWVKGSRRLDPAIVSNVRLAQDGWSATSGVAERVNSLSPGEILVVEGDDQRYLAALLTVTDPERTSDVDRLRRSRPEIPRMQRVGCAIGCEGRSVEDVVDRIRDRTDVDIRACTSARDRRVPCLDAPSTLVLLDADCADDPDALVRDVLEPLVSWAGVLCLRVVVGVRDPGAAAAAAVRHSLERHAAASEARLDQVGRLLADLSGQESDLRAVQQTFESRSVRDYSGRLTLGLRMLGEDVRSDAGVDQRELGELECAVSRLEGELIRLRPVVRRNTSRRDDLRALRSLTRIRSLRLERGEDVALDSLFEETDEALRTRPIDLDKAEAAIRAYEDAVRRLEDEKDGADEQNQVDEMDEPRDEDDPDDGEVAT